MEDRCCVVLLVFFFGFFFNVSTHIALVIVLSCLV